jgi:hypothetical protein
MDIERLLKLSGINEAFSSEKNYADKTLPELKAIKSELQSVMARRGKMSWTWKEANDELTKVNKIIKDKEELHEDVDVVDTSDDSSDDTDDTDDNSIDEDDDDDTVTEGKEDTLWVLKIAEPDSDKFGIQFSGTRKECIDEWNDTKHSWPKGSKKKIERHVEESVMESMTDSQKEKREEIVKSMKSKEDEFKQKYGKRWKEVMYATATKMAMESVEDKDKSDNDESDNNDKKIADDVTDTANKMIESEQLNVDNSPKENDTVTTDLTKKLKTPKEVISDVKKRISELDKAISIFDNSEFNDSGVKQQAIDCLEKILEDLKRNDAEGVKNAQIYLGTLMSPIVDFFPPRLINWLANALNNINK